MPRQAATVSREVRIIPRVDCVCVVATEGSAMIAPTSDRLASHPAEPHWDQTSFLAEDAGSEARNRLSPRPDPCWRRSVPRITPQTIPPDMLPSIV